MPKYRPTEGEPGDGRRVPGAGRLHGLLGGRGPAGRGDAVGAGERLQAAAVAAAAWRPVGLDRLVAELAAGPVVARWTRPSMAMTPPTPVPSVSPIIDEAPASGTQPQLGEPERPRVVDEGGRAGRARAPTGPATGPARPRPPGG